MTKNFKTYFRFYLISLFFFSIIFLIEKHDVGSDSTISEWLINYSGGFTKRGIIGQISIFISNLLSIGLRENFNFSNNNNRHLLFFILNFIKNIKTNRIIILSILTPIFLLYPVAEIEVLARKEFFIFCIFICYLFSKFKKRNIFKILILPLAVLIWEPVVFYFII